MADSRRIEHVAAAWLARRDAGPWTDQDQQALDAWRDQDTEHRVALLRLESAWHQAGRLQALAAGLPEGEVPPRHQWSDWVASGAREPAASNGGAIPHAPDLSAVAFAPRRAATRSTGWRRGLAANRWSGWLHGAVRKPRHSGPAHGGSHPRSTPPARARRTQPSPTTGGAAAPRLRAARRPAPATARPGARPTPAAAAPPGARCPGPARHPAPAGPGRSMARHRGAPARPRRRAQSSCCRPCPVSPSAPVRGTRRAGTEAPPP